MNLQARRAAEQRRLRGKGVVLLLVLALLVAFSVATYRKTFQSAVVVQVEVDRAGLQLNEYGDVRVRGALVGRIGSISQRDGRAVIELALDPDSARGISSASQVRILPTTLFGQKYVELVPPSADRAGRALRDGDLLVEARGAAAVEIGALLDRLEPVLSAVRPQDLMLTLDAVATGLDGRGEKLGRIAVDTRALLAGFDASLPLLVRDLRLLARVSTQYAAIAPTLLEALDDLSVTSATVTGRKAAIATLLAEVTRFSGIGQAFLERNTPALASVVRDARPVASLLSRYSPEFGCLLAGLRIAERAAATPFTDGTFHVRMILGKPVRGYTAKDLPLFGNAGRGPDCVSLPRATGPVPAFGSAVDGVGSAR